MGKSDLKSVLEQACPGVFSLSGLEDITFPVVIQDTVVSLRKFGHSVASSRNYANSDFIGIDTVVAELFDPAVAMLTQSTCYVALFDKASEVTVAKQPEQDKRDEEPEPNGQNVSLAIEVRRVRARMRHAIRNNTLANLKLSAASWALAINDRAARADTIIAVCLHAKNTLPALMQEHCVPESHFLVLDFEDLSSGESSATPLVISASGCAPGDTFRNSLGEFDVASMFYLHHPELTKLSGGTGCVLVDSVDTDMLPITLVNCNGRSDIRVKTTLTQPRRNVYFNPRVLRQWLEASGSSECVDDFVRMYILAGSDFVDSCPGMSNLTAMKTYLSALQPSFKLQPESIVSSSLKKGVVRASASKRALQLRERKSKYDIASCSARSHWCLNYWKHSVLEPHKLITSPVGHGFSLKNGRIVYTEELLASRVQRTNTTSLKRAFSDVIK